MDGNKPSFLTEDSGKPSSMRLVSVMFAVAAIGLAASDAAMLWYGLQPGNQMMVLYFLGASLGGKLWQKYMEHR